MNKLIRVAVALAFAITLPQTAVSLSLSTNNTGAAADPSAILYVSNTAKGMVVSWIDKTQKNAIATPVNALLVYQSGPDCIGFHFYVLPNTYWVFISPDADDTDTWKITGNSSDQYSLAYSQFVVPLVKAVQEQQQMIVNQKKTSTI